MRLPVLESWSPRGQVIACKAGFQVLIESTKQRPLRKKPYALYETFSLASYSAVPTDHPLMYAVACERNR